MKYFLVLVVALGAAYFYFSGTEDEKIIPLTGMGNEAESEKMWRSSQRKEYLRQYSYFYHHGLYSALQVVREAEWSCRAVYIERSGGSEFQDLMVKGPSGEKYEQIGERCRIFSLAMSKINEVAMLRDSLGSDEMRSVPLYYFEWLSGDVGGKHFFENGPGLKIGPFYSEADCDSLSQEAASEGFHVSHCRSYEKWQRWALFSQPNTE